ncbi:hypothetical protein V1511DRAFT_449301, partial [Dipodascopsis uninucleata]
RWPDVESPNPYDIFHMTRGSVDRRILKKRYYTLMQQYHPDKLNIRNDETEISREALTIMKERYDKIRDAYEILSDPYKRSRYDRFGEGWKYPTQVNPKSPVYERYNFSKEEWERMKYWRMNQDDRMKYGPMWAAGRYPGMDETEDEPVRKASTPIDHEANIRTLMWIVAFTGIVTYIQGLRIMSWSDKYDDKVRELKLDDSNVGYFPFIQRLFKRESGIQFESRNKSSYDEFNTGNPLDRIQSLRKDFRFAALAENVNIESEDFKKMEN